MKQFFAAGALALGLAASAASAASYNLFDHALGGLASKYDYGLRLDALNTGSRASEFWSFEDAADNSMAKLRVDIAGGTGEITGQMRNNDDQALWDLNLTLSGVTAIGTDGSFGADSYKGTLTNGSMMLDIIGKARNVNGTHYAWTLLLSDPHGNSDFRAPNISAGWVASVDGGASMLRGGANDFIAMVNVPLPAGAVLLLTGLGALRLTRRKS